MLEVKLTITNDNLDRVQEWAEDEQQALVPYMIAAQPNYRTDTSTTIFAMLESLRQQIRDFKILLAEKEAAAKK